MPTKRVQPDYPDFVDNLRDRTVDIESDMNFATNPNDLMPNSRGGHLSEPLSEEMLLIREHLRQMRGEDASRLLQAPLQAQHPFNFLSPRCSADCPQICKFCNVFFHKCQTQFKNIHLCDKCHVDFMQMTAQSYATTAEPAIESNQEGTRMLANPLGQDLRTPELIQQLLMNDKRQVRSITNRRQVSPELAARERSRQAQDQSHAFRSSVPTVNGQEDGVQDIFTRVDHFNVSSVDGVSAPKRKTNHKKLVINSKVRRIMVGHAKKFGQYGNNPGELSEPSGVATNSKGEILVVDSNNRRINIYNGMGEHLRCIEGQDPNSTSVMFANRIAICPITGNIIITERPPTKVGKILSPSGLLLKKFGEGIIEHPRGLAVDRCGRILVLQSMVGRVDIFSMEGELLNGFQLAMEFPFSIATNRFEEIFVADNKKHLVKVYDYKGNHLRDIGGEGVTNFPVGVNIGKNDEVVVCDNHNNFNITIFDREGNPIVGLKGEIKHTQCYGVTLTDNYEIILCSKDYEVCKYQIEPRHLDRSNQLSFYKGENEVDDDDMDNVTEHHAGEQCFHLPCNNNANNMLTGLSNNYHVNFPPNNILSGRPVNHMNHSPLLNINNNNNNRNNATSASNSNENISALFRELTLSGRSSGLGSELPQRMMPSTSGLNSPAQMDRIPFSGTYVSSSSFLDPRMTEGQNVPAMGQRMNSRSLTSTVFDPRGMGGEYVDERLAQYRAPGGPVPLFGQIATPSRNVFNPLDHQLGNGMPAKGQSRFNGFMGPR